MKVLKTLHSNDVIHGDVHQGNIGFDYNTFGDLEPKLIDVGRSVDLRTIHSIGWTSNHYKLLKYLDVVGFLRNLWLAILKQRHSYSYRIGRQITSIVFDFLNEYHVFDEYHQGEDACLLDETIHLLVNEIQMTVDTSFTDEVITGYLNLLEKVQRTKLFTTSHTPHIDYIRFLTTR
jgi:hypothetical protein